MAGKKKQQKPWQFHFSFTLALLMLVLIAGYFLQSFNEIRQVRPVRVAIERVTGVEKPSATTPRSEERGDQ